jgi:hypothetical protein
LACNFVSNATIKVTEPNRITKQGIKMRVMLAITRFYAISIHKPSTYKNYSMLIPQIEQRQIMQTKTHLHAEKYFRLPHYFTGISVSAAN